MLSDAEDATVTFAVDAAGAELRIRVSGELDLACAELFDGLFDIDTTGIETLVLDLAGLTFCDVTGVNALAGLADFHRAHGRDVRVMDVLPHVLRLIALTRGAATPARGTAPA